MSAPSATAPTGLPSASIAGPGPTLVALAGLGLVGYGLMFLLRNFSGFIELGLTPQLIGGTPDEIRAIMTRMLDMSGPFEHASLQINFADMDYEPARQSLRLFAREVMPHFSKAAGSAAAAQ